MKKSVLGAAILMAMGSTAANANVWDFAGTFTHYDSDGNLSGHVDTLVSGVFDLGAGSGAFTSGINFQGSPWVADVDMMFQYDTATGGVQNFTYAWTNKDIFTGSAVVKCRTGAMNLDGCAGVTGSVLVSATNNYTFSMNGAGQFAAGMFFDWSTNLDIPVLAVLQGLDDPSDGQFAVISLDSDGDGVPGHQMKTSPFPGHTADFAGTLTMQQTVVPVPAAVWLFGSGLLGLVGVARRKKT